MTRSRRCRRDVGVCFHLSISMLLGVTALRQAHCDVMERKVPIAWRKQIPQKYHFFRRARAGTVAPRGESGLRVWVQQQLLCGHAYVLRVSWGVSSKRDGVFIEHCDQAARPSNLDFAGEEAGTASDWSDGARRAPFEVRHKQLLWLGGRQEP